MYVALESEGLKCRVDDLRGVLCLAEIDVSSDSLWFVIVKKHSLFSINQLVLQNKQGDINKSTKLQGG